MQAKLLHYNQGKLIDICMIIKQPKLAMNLARTPISMELNEALSCPIGFQNFETLPQ